LAFASSFNGQNQPPGQAVGLVIEKCLKWAIKVGLKDGATKGCVNG